MTPDCIWMFHEMWGDYRRAMRLRRTAATRSMYRSRVRLSLFWVREFRKAVLP